MRVGITATQKGLTAAQAHFFTQKLLELRATELHHGDCIGGDADGHRIARSLGLKVVIHPPINPSKRAWCHGDLILPTADYLERNHNIVNSTAHLIAMPAGDQEELRSGTWATWRYAKRINRSLTLILPLGTTIGI